MYGILIAAGAFAAILLSEKLIRERSLSVEIYYRGVNIALVAGVLGARLYHVAHYLHFYRENPLMVFAVWRGGLGIIGGLILGGLAAIIYLKKRGQDISRWIDPLFVGIPMAQAIGRWGNYFNQELYGIRTDLPWGWQINGERYHPLFLYESVLCGILFLSMLLLYKRDYDLPKGALAAFYIGGYSIIRFFLEFLKINPWSLGPITVAQMIALAGVISVFIWSITLIRSKC